VNRSTRTPHARGLTSLFEERKVRDHSLKSQEFSLIKECSLLYSLLFGEYSLLYGLLFEEYRVRDQSFRPRVEKSHSNHHELLVCWIVSILRVLNVKQTRYYLHYWFKQVSLPYQVVTRLKNVP